eukprot:482381-Pyramimonas_sp.AAC.1
MGSQQQQVASSHVWQHHTLGFALGECRLGPATARCHRLVLHQLQRENLLDRLARPVVRRD